MTIHVIYHAVVQCMVATARARERGREFCDFNPYRRTAA